MQYRDRLTKFLHYVPHRNFLNIWKVELSDGSVGFGESPTHGPGATERADEETPDDIVGQNPFEIMWDRSLRKGLRMALFDASATSVGRPVSDLIGTRFHEHISLAWWCTAMPPSAWEQEVRTGLRRGYRAFKLKARPWFDIWEGLETISSVIEQFEGHAHVGIDFNETFVDVEDALPVLTELEKDDGISFVESPLAPDDVAGYQRLSDALRTNLVMHFGKPSVRENIKNELCDGYILSGETDSILAGATVAGELGMPGYVQIAGTGISTAFAMQIASTITPTNGPIVTWLNIYESNLLTEPLTLTEGEVPVPQGPGLGVPIDEDAIAVRKTRPPTDAPRSRAVLEVTMPGHQPRYYVSNLYDMLEQVQRDGYLSYARGVDTTIITENDCRHEAAFSKAIQGRP